jgi:hypothetical protein
MTAEKVLAGLLEPGDVICVHHHHDSRCGECLAPWQTEAVITGRPAAVSGRLVVTWAAGTWPPGGRGAVTGVSVFSPDEQVVRVGRPPAARPGALALMPGAGASPTPGHRSWLVRGAGVPHIAALPVSVGERNRSMQGLWGLWLPWFGVAESAPWAPRELPGSASGRADQRGDDDPDQRIPDPPHPGLTGRRPPRRQKRPAHHGHRRRPAGCQKGGGPRA